MTPIGVRSIGLKGETDSGLGERSADNGSPEQPLTGYSVNWGNQGGIVSLLDTGHRLE
jgi:hypothetical protein